MSGRKRLLRDRASSARPRGGTSAVHGLPRRHRAVVVSSIAHELWRILMEAGVHVDVEPRGIFTTLIPTQVLLQPGSTPTSRRGESGDQ